MTKQETTKINSIIQNLLEIRKDSFVHHIHQINDVKFQTEMNMLPEDHPIHQHHNEINQFYNDLGIDQNEINNMTDEEFDEAYDSQFYEYQHTYSNIWEEFHSRFDKTLVELNALLETNDQLDEVLEIEKKMQEIKSKKFITTSQFELLYGYGTDWQKNKRSKTKESLPYIQEYSGATIRYDVKEVENWFDQMGIRR